MDVKYQIFISSTFQDLEDERRKVIEAVLNLGHIPVGMEIFQAGDETQWKYIKRRILDCDYYLLIIAERYGSETTNGKSYTQLEYEFALKSKIPTIAFLLNETARASWPQNKIEFEKKDKVQKFRSLCEKKISKYWMNGDDLSAKVLSSLVEIIREKPGIGWVKATAAASPETLAEITKLSDEKRSLQLRLSQLESKSQGLLMPEEIRHNIKKLSSMRLGRYVHIDSDEHREKIIAIDISVLYAFRLFRRSFAAGFSTIDIGKRIIEIFELPPKTAMNIFWFTTELVVRNLIVSVGKEHQSGGSTITRNKYFLTDFGKTFLMHAEAAKPKNLPETIKN